MKKLYGVAAAYRKMFGREVIEVWTGPFMLTWEAEGVALPKGDGYMLKTYAGHKVRVTCPSPRTDDNYEEVDRAINDALNNYYGKD